MIDCFVNLLLFTDDTKIFSVIESPSNLFKSQSNLDKFFTNGISKTVYD